MLPERGDLASQYACAPGRIVDVVRLGNRTWLLISLGEVKHRGDQVQLEVTRVLSDAFFSSDESVTVTTVGRPRRLTARIVFPEGRNPLNALAVCEGSHGAQELELSSESVADRAVLRLQVPRPRPNALYAIRWTWPPVGVYVSHSDGTASVAKQLTELFADRGVAATASQDIAESDRQRCAAVIEQASAIVLIVSDDRPSAMQQVEWSAGVGFAWERDNRPVVLLLYGHTQTPQPLATLRQVRLSTDPRALDQQLHLIAEGLWSEPQLEHADLVGSEPPIEPLPLTDQPLPALAPEELDQRVGALEEALRSTGERPDDPEAGLIELQLGVMHRHRGEFQEARKLLEHAIETTERSLGEGAPTLADAKYNLAEVMDELGEPDRAKKLLEEAVALGERNLGVESSKGDGLPGQARLPAEPPKVSESTFPPPERCVFINCPYDESYRPLMDAMILGTVACDLTPRSAIDRADKTRARLDRICDLISECRYSIHELSRCTGEGELGYARFNMPLELGMAIEKHYLAQDHEWLALVPAGYGYLRFVSDLSGFDPTEHDNTEEGLLSKVMRWLNVTSGGPPPPTPRLVIERLAAFKVARADLDANWLGATEWEWVVAAAREALRGLIPMDKPR